MNALISKKPSTETTLGITLPLHQTIVKRKRRDNRLIALGALLELGHVQAAVLVLVHHAEDLAHSLLGCVFVFGKLDHGADLWGLAHAT